MEGKKSKPDWNIQMMLDYNKNYNNKNIEPIQDLFKRVYTFLDDIIEKYNSKNVLLVTHGGVSMAIDCYFNGMPEIGNFDTLIPHVPENCEIKKYKIT
jgi:broad specificity phosphatase PhoE